ncbi:MAG: endonuclease/exonuclease/phosphatase family protein [Solirubrobacterales bacterium]
MEFTAVSWNLFHGRDFPPDPALFTWRSRLLRVTERNDAHVQVNQDLMTEFATVLANAEWDVAMLQECPPRFAAPLALACAAGGHRALTSRNSLGALRAAVARLNPDLVASGEGGSNLTLVREAGPLGRILERREAVIHEGRPERRAMAFVRTGSGVCIANLHATNNRPTLAIEDVLRAAETARAWAGEDPLLFGGDLNLRPAEDAALFTALRDRFGLAGTTGPGAIDHLLSRGLRIATQPMTWPAERRELLRDGLALRLSDHAPVQARFKIGGAGG